MFSLIAAMGLLNACSKLAYNTQLRFEVSNELETKATLVDHSESGADIIWEEGDVITMEIDIYQDVTKSPLNSVNGMILYQDGKWKTYEAKGSSLVEQESISVSSDFPDSKVRINFKCVNGDTTNPDENTFIAHWVRVIPFTEGPQTILVTLPFNQ